MSKQISSTELKVPCPTCRKQVKRSGDFFPFCSKRCQTTDLGQWASDGYAIAGDQAFFPDQPDDYA